MERGGLEQEGCDALSAVVAGIGRTQSDSFCLSESECRTLIVDWRSRAKRLVAEFRSDAGRHLNEPPTTRLISELQAASGVFARYWSEQDVREREGGARTFRSTTGAISTYSQVSLIPSIQHRSQACRAHSGRINSAMSPANQKPSSETITRESVSAPDPVPQRYILLTDDFGSQRTLA